MSDHVAIMNPSWKLIPKILSGEKTIESRWYQTRRAPWDGLRVDDRVFFKGSGKFVTATARVAEVLQFQIETLRDAEQIVKKYGEETCLVNPNPRTWGKLPKYCVLVRLKDPAVVKKPFAIDKRGFGTGAAWLMVKDIDQVRV
ncbi:MAG: hypothetical protein AAB839_01280 [Patescibacteria group bacterium]